MVLASWGRLYFSKMVAIIPPIPQALLTKWTQHSCIGSRRAGVNVPPPGICHTEFEESSAMRLVKLDDKNAMHFYHALLVYSLLESSCLFVRKPILAREDRPHGEITSSAEAPNIMEAVTQLSHCAFFEFLMHRIMHIIKWCLYATKFWGGLLCSNSNENNHTELDV